MSNFIEQCLAGKVMTDEIDDFVDEWHRGKSSMPLHKFLGMNRGEYALWLTNDETLPLIVRAHKYDTSFEQEFSKVSRTAIAARSANVQKTREVISWLKKQGLWE